MASVEGSRPTPPVDPETTETPSTMNSLFRVRLPLMESCEALMPVAAPPLDTPPARVSRLRTFRLGSGRFRTCAVLITRPSEESSVSSRPMRSPTTVMVSWTSPGARAASTRARWSTSRRTPWMATVLKPGSSTVRS
jgi:hypothetical protein